MNETWELEWAEFREADYSRELFFIAASESPQGWTFSARSTWEVSWQRVPPDMRLVWAAEYFKRIAVQRRPITGSITYAVRNEQSRFTAIQILDDVDTILKTKRTSGDQSIVAEMRLRGVRLLAQPLAGQHPDGALAA